MFPPVMTGYSGGEYSRLGADSSATGEGAGAGTDSSMIGRTSVSSGIFSRATSSIGSSAFDGPPVARATPIAAAEPASNSPAIAAI